MDVKVIGTGCDKCDQLYANTVEALAQLGVEAKVEKVEDLMEIVRLGVMTAPALMVNGKLLLSGQAAKPAQIAKAIRKVL